MERQQKHFSWLLPALLVFPVVMPISATARTFSYLQAVFGQFYIAILVAGLVSADITKYLTSAD
jgi:hypothetical protein